MKPILKTINIFCVFMTIKDILITVMDEINYGLYENNVT